eukprot:jgi/Picsp_1/2371/NSC_05834-R1_protein
MVEHGVLAGRLWSWARTWKGIILFFGGTLLTITLHFILGKSCVTLKTAVGTSCEQVWEQRRKSSESYIGLVNQKEIERESNIAAWNGKRAYDMYEPEWVCDTEKRVGPGDVSIGDGPKFVCAPDSLKDENKCLIYSIGSNYNFQFEEGIRKHAPNCEFHTFDGTMNLTNRGLSADLEEKRIHFHNWNVDTASGTKDKGWMSKTIEDIVSELGHIERTIHVFKIDCEGCEYNVMPQVIDMVKNGRLIIEQIQVEMHGTDAAKIQTFFQTMRSAGYAVFHKERNHWGCNGYACVEYAFIGIEKSRSVFKRSHCHIENTPNTLQAQMLKNEFRKVTEEDLSSLPPKRVLFTHFVTESRMGELAQFSG